MFGGWSASPEANILLDIAEECYEIVVQIMLDKNNFSQHNPWLPESIANFLLVPSNVLKVYDV